MTRKVGSLERSSPLPAGSYWFDAFGLNIPKADNWLKTFGPFGVHTDATQHFESPDVATVRNWYKFTYTPVGTFPVVWDTTLGFPTVADGSIKSSEDTVQRPDLPLDPLTRLSDWVDSIEARVGGTLGSAAVIVPYAIIGGGLYLLGQVLFTGSAVRKVRTWNKKKK